jgi:hypothetical protein
MKTSAKTALALLASVLLPATAMAAAGQAEPWQIGLQDAASPVSEYIHWFHNMLLVIITVITLFVLALLIYVMVKFNAKAKCSELCGKDHAFMPIEVHVYSTNHKDIGTMYLIFAIYRHMLQRVRDRPRPDHDLLHGHAGHDRRLRQLVRAAHDRRAGHGVPAHEQHLVLAAAGGARSRCC